MKTYRSKQFEAIQFTGTQDNLKEIIASIKSNIKGFGYEGHNIKCIYINDCLLGFKTVQIGDYIRLFENGDICLCDKNFFEGTYDIIEHSKFEKIIETENSKCFLSI